MNSSERKRGNRFDSSKKKLRRVRGNSFIFQGCVRCHIRMPRSRGQTLGGHNEHVSRKHTQGEVFPDAQDLGHLKSPWAQSYVQS
jgi:hypothetical protein